MPDSTKYGKAKRIADEGKREEALRKLAAEVLALRDGDDGKGKRPWDGPNGLRAKGYVRTAGDGRELLRKHGPLRKGRKIGTGNGIEPSYVRDAAFRAEESARRIEKAEAQRKADEKAERKAKREAKAAAKASA
jgi:hypothetical protein